MTLQATCGAMRRSPRARRPVVAAGTVPVLVTGEGLPGA